MNECNKTHWADSSSSAHVLQSGGLAGRRAVTGGLAPQPRARAMLRPLTRTPRVDAPAGPGNQGGSDRCEVDEVALSNARRPTNTSRPGLPTAGLAHTPGPARARAAAPGLCSAWPCTGGARGQPRRCAGARALADSRCLGHADVEAHTQRAAAPWPSRARTRRARSASSSCSCCRRRAAARATWCRGPCRAPRAASRATAAPATTTTGTRWWRPSGSGGSTSCTSASSRTPPRAGRSSTT